MGTIKNTQTFNNLDLLLVNEKPNHLIKVNGDSAFIFREITSCLKRSLRLLSYDWTDNIYTGQYKKGLNDFLGKNHTKLEIFIPNNFEGVVPPFIDDHLHFKTKKVEVFHVDFKLCSKTFGWDKRIRKCPMIGDEYLVHNRYFDSEEKVWFSETILDKSAKAIIEYGKLSSLISTQAQMIA